MKTENICLQASMLDIDKEIFDILNEYAGGKLDFNALKRRNTECCLS